MESPAAKPDIWILEGCRNLFSGSAVSKQSPESLGKKGGKSWVFFHCGKFMAF